MRTCRITGSAGSKDGRVGKLKSNILGLQYGVYYDSLPKDLDRIIPWLGEGNCSQLGWEFNFKGAGGCLVHTDTGQAIPIRSHPRLQLPILACNLFKEETDSGYICSTVEEGVSSCYLTRLELHRRCGHFHIDGLQVNCPECDLHKGQRAPHAKARDTSNYKPEPLKLLAIDFAVGIKPVSVRSKRCVLVIICDVIKKVFCRPLKLKSDCVEEIEEVIKGIRQDYSLSLDDKVVWFLRRDGEPVLSSDDMTKVMQSLRVSDSPAVPYNPEMNGTCERFMRTLFGSVRTMLTKVDKRLWCYCVEYAGDCWDRLPHNYAKMPQHDGKSPIEILEERTGRNSSKSSIGMLRRFGCLVYFREQIQANTPEPKLSAKYRRGVFLGLCPKSSGWLVGTFAHDDRCKLGHRWAEYSTLDVKFREDYLIKNIDWLLPDQKGIYIEYDELENLQSGASSL
ncbi:unnamed protein product, partial [Amoebophrya sp. A25]|eukprot:GSA25T00010764001.1